MSERVFSVDTTLPLRLRQAPHETAPILARLEPGQVVARLDEEDREGWFWVFADVPGDGVYIGYVAGRFLSRRTPGDTPPSAMAASAFAAQLADCCFDEWRFFARGAVKEQDEPARSRIKEYWAALNIHDRDGASPYAWSAAFISFMMRKAGAGDRFLYAPAHCDYINKAIRDQDRVEAAFRACRPEAYAPQVGDLIARARPTRDHPREATFDTARNIGFYTSHTDIVVAVEPGRIITIGGNVSQSVTQEQLPAQANGRIGSATVQARKIFAVLRNALIEPV